MMTDPIADMLTRIRNGNNAKHDSVDIPASNIKKQLAQILLDEGFIKGFDVIDDGKQGIIRVDLKYGKHNEKVISGIKRISKPGLRVYVKSDEVPRVLGGLGIAILSTSSGIMTDKVARKEGVGGEVICYVW
ncbi:30S ribosomal protein S8 [Tissierella praeacuta]|uniref:Small ribosomal subunit protein uS8 n=1 Tax=Tissierella praeacuta DSM 18095 TaxID=1123404 RepID=A0A1M4Y9C5_9FIRM|nr:30S ribosomal protein S8 [Tissierella praeacuta]MBU5256335.1 30S ribosomal protein S8 [Tissierella praeacuta]TCU69696.1 small subunit ribosomal protein S8 [Tissierella praeacuta]SHF02361.1 small subunit ribosomal protein S8 [Tissierella praeacuta DSM 18095]SUP03277.1 30S ribosomal protein S8 [Tissierella praeacuta]